MTRNKGTCSSDDERQGFYSLDMCRKERQMDGWLDDQLCRTHLTFGVPPHSDCTQSCPAYPKMQLLMFCNLPKWLSNILSNIRTSALALYTKDQVSKWCRNASLLKPSVTPCLNLANEFSTCVASAGRFLQFARGPPELPDVKSRNTWQVFLMQSELNWF